MVALYLLLKHRTAGLKLLGLCGASSAILAATAVVGLYPYLHGGWCWSGSLFWEFCALLEDTPMIAAVLVPGSLISLVAAFSNLGTPLLHREQGAPLKGSSGMEGEGR